MVVRNNIIVILGSAKENVCNHQREYLVDERISETLRKGNAKSFRGNDLHGGLTAMATPRPGNLFGRIRERARVRPNFTRAG
jgi:hypothetical protein